MPRKIDVSESSESGDGSKPKTYLTIVLGVLIACALFYGIITGPLLNDYINGSKCIPNLYDFYDLKVGYNTTAVYFVGASYVGNSVYPIEINRILKEKGYDNITVYTTYVSSEGPLDRVIHLQKLIDSKPSMVIYGAAVSSLSKNFINEEDVLIVRDRLNIREDSLKFYTPEETEQFNKNKDIWEMKRFVPGALRSLLVKNTVNIGYDYNYLTDPFGGAEKRIINDKIYYDENALEQLRQPDYSIEYDISNSSRPVKAFYYILDVLEEENIDVVVVNAPINPLRSDKITNETRQKYFDVLNGSGYEWIDFEYSLPEEYFFDGIHPTFDGAMILAPK